MNKTQTDVVAAGRGFLFIAFAKFYFLITSTVVNLALPRLLDDPALYGDYRVVNSFLSVITMVMITGTIQAVSKLVSENEKNAIRVQKLSLRIQSVVGTSTAIIIFILSDVIAAFLLNDAALSSYLKITSLIILFYAFYAVYIGLLNGLKQFHKQAACDIIFSTIKTGLILFLVLYGFYVAGAFWGFAAAAFLIVPVSVKLTRLPPGFQDNENASSSKISLRSLLNYMIPIMLYTLLLNLLIQLDVLLLKSMSFNLIRENLLKDDGKIQISLLFQAIGFSDKILNESFTDISFALASGSTSIISGIFGAAKNIALIPYQVVISITFVIFPLISKATFEGDQQKAREQVKNALRFALILSSFIMVSILSEPVKLLSMMFGQEYAAAGYSLIFLLLGTVLFSLFSVGNTILTSAGHPRLSLGIGIISVLINAVGIFVLICVSGPDESLVFMVSVGVLISMAINFIICGAFVIWRFGTLIPFGTICRTILSVAIVLIMGSFISVQSLKYIILKFITSGFTFFILMGILGEFKKNEFVLLKKIVFRNKI